MRKLLSFFILGLFISAAHAQKTDGIIKGKLVDTSGKQPISDATVSVLQAKDSSLVTFTLSNKQGIFEIRGLSLGDYRLIITHQAYLELKNWYLLLLTKNWLI